MKKQKQTEQPSNPFFTSKCHPSCTVDYREIVEDSMPSRTIAVVGRCHACMGMQRIVECTHNIDRKKLIQALHGNGNWLLTEKVVEGLRESPDLSHGELVNVSLPKPTRAGAPMPAPDKDLTEPKGYNGTGPF